MASTAQALRALWASYSAVGADGAPRCMDADAFADLCEACPGLLTDVFTLDDALDAYDAAVAPDDTAAADASPPSQGLSFSQFVAALEGVAEDRYPGVDFGIAYAQLLATHVFRIRRKLVPPTQRPPPAAVSAHDAGLAAAIDAAPRPLLLTTTTTTTVRAAAAGAPHAATTPRVDGALGAAPSPPRLAAAATATAATSGGGLARPVSAALAPAPLRPAYGGSVRGGSLAALGAARQPGAASFPGVTAATLASTTASHLSGAPTASSAPLASPTSLPASSSATSLSLPSSLQGLSPLRPKALPSPPHQLLPPPGGAAASVPSVSFALPPMPATATAGAAAGPPYGDTFITRAAPAAAAAAAGGQWRDPLSRLALRAIVRSLERAARACALADALRVWAAHVAATTQQATLWRALAAEEAASSAQSQLAASQLLAQQHQAQEQQQGQAFAGAAHHGGGGWAGDGGGGHDHGPLDYRALTSGVDGGSGSGASSEPPQWAQLQQQGQGQGQQHAYHPAYPPDATGGGGEWLQQTPVRGGPHHGLHVETPGSSLLSGAAEGGRLGASAASGSSQRRPPVATESIGSQTAPLPELLLQAPPPSADAGAAALPPGAVAKTTALLARALGPRPVARACGCAWWLLRLLAVAAAAWGALAGGRHAVRHHPAAVVAGVRRVAAARAQALASSQGWAGVPAVVWRPLVRLATPDLRVTTASADDAAGSDGGSVPAGCVVWGGRVLDICEGSGGGGSGHDGGGVSGVATLPRGHGFSLEHGSSDGAPSFGRVPTTVEAEKAVETPVESDASVGAGAGASPTAFSSEEAVAMGTGADAGEEQRLPSHGGSGGGRTGVARGESVQEPQLGGPSRGVVRTPPFSGASVAPASGAAPPAAAAAAAAAASTPAVTRARPGAGGRNFTSGDIAPGAPPSSPPRAVSIDALSGAAVPVRGGASIDTLSGAAVPVDDAQLGGSAGAGRPTRGRRWGGGGGRSGDAPGGTNAAGLAGVSAGERESELGGSDAGARGDLAPSLLPLPTLRVEAAGTAGGGVESAPLRSAAAGGDASVKGGARAAVAGAHASVGGAHTSLLSMDAAVAGAHAGGNHVSLLSLGAMGGNEAAPAVVSGAGEVTTSQSSTGAGEEVASATAGEVVPPATGEAAAVVTTLRSAKVVGDPRAPRSGYGGGRRAEEGAGDDTPASPPSPAAVAAAVTAATATSPPSAVPATTATTAAPPFPPAATITAPGVVGGGLDAPPARPAAALTVAAAAPPPVAALPVDDEIAF